MERGRRSSKVKVKVKVEVKVRRSMRGMLSLCIATALRRLEYRDRGLGTAAAVAV